MNSLLTGKCKEDFKDFLYNKYGVLCELNDYNETMLNAEIIDFFDEKGIYVNAIRYNNHYFQAYCNYFMHEKYETRQEATTEAIKKANEIYNGSI